MTTRVNVKNTMRELLSNLVFPHYCCACGKIGSVICERCKYDIVNEPYESCLVCRLPTAAAEALCRSCRQPYTRAWCVGEHQGALRKLIADYKFNRMAAASRALATLLAETTPELPLDVTVVPVPTVAAHIRHRGYDHAALIARQFSQQKSLPFREILERATNDRQRGSGRRERIAQAKRAFAVRQPIAGTVLLVDDVFTTGATLHYAAEKVREAGASDVWIAVVSREPLD